MDLRHRAVGRRGQHHKALALGAALPAAGQQQRRAVGTGESIFCLWPPALGGELVPLKKAAGGHQTAAQGKALAEHRPLRHRLGPGVHHRLPPVLPGQSPSGARTAPPPPPRRAPPARARWERPPPTARTAAAAPPAAARGTGRTGPASSFDQYNTGSTNRPASSVLILSLSGCQPRVSRRLDPPEKEPGRAAPGAQPRISQSKPLAMRWGTPVKWPPLFHSSTAFCGPSCPCSSSDAARVPGPRGTSARPGCAPPPCPARDSSGTPAAPGAPPARRPSRRTTASRKGWPPARIRAGRAAVQRQQAAQRISRQRRVARRTECRTAPPPPVLLCPPAGRDMRPRPRQRAAAPQGGAGQGV